MSSRFPDAARRAVLVAAGLAAVACEREERRFREVPPSVTASEYVLLNDQVQPGPVIQDPDVESAYLESAYMIGQGKRLYTNWNCAGCHSPRGGGGFGPSLIDSLWIYGSEPENIFSTILQGRPRGMPAFRGHLSNDQIWQLVAHVRQQAALTTKDTRPGRSEGMHGTSADPQSDPMLPMEQQVPAEQLPPGRGRRP